MNNGTYDYITENAHHMKALGQDRVWMSDDEPIRWDLVTDVETGGSWRLSLSTSQRVIAKHPSGILMSWTIDLEPRSASGSSKYHLDTDRIKMLLTKAPRYAQAKLRIWLRESKETIDKHIKEQAEYLNRMNQISTLFGEALDDN